MTLPAPSIREQLLEKIWETLDPLFDGGCKRFVQEGQPVAETLPCAILRWTEDATLTLEAAGIAGGRRSKRMRCVVEVRCFHDTEEVGPDKLPWSDTVADAQLILAEDAIAQLSESPEWRALTTDPDIGDITAFMGNVQSGESLTRAVVTFTVTYRHQNFDATGAA